MSTTAAPLQHSARATGAPPAAGVAGIRVASSQLRSVNLERDIQADQLGPVYVGARTQDLLTRLATALDDRTRPRAWSVTGPYGSGKSTLALLLEALLGPDAERRSQAHQLVAAASPDLAGQLADARAAWAPHGFLSAAATARREPLAATLTRAVVSAADRRWPSAPPSSVSAAIAPLRHATGDSTRVLTAIRALCRQHPLLLVVDEFGKILENLTASDDAGADQDLYLLQELAELGSSSAGLSLFTLTLQHLSFLDYAAQSNTLQRREWAKIQGRFDDLTFSPDLTDAVQLLTRHLDQSAISAAARQRISQYGQLASHAWHRRGLDGVLSVAWDLFAALYPLHPLTAVAAPLLAAQAGQHERTLTGFLAGDEPHTVARFLVDHDPAGPTTTVGLPQLYDYFLTSGRTTLLASVHASRWIEIDTRISDAHGLAEQDRQVLKTVGLLNLIDTSGALRASAELVLFALTEPADTSDGQACAALRQRLDELVDRGFLVYRRFSDEYRLWHGSDVDLRARIDELREHCTTGSVAQMLTQDHLPAAVAGGAHSQRTGMLRHFITTATDPDTGHLVGPAVEDPADGLLIYHLGSEQNVPSIDSPLPVVVGISPDTRTVLDHGRQLLALTELLAEEGLDAVARREAAERAGQARAELAVALAEAFSPDQPVTRWYLLPPYGGDPPGEAAFSGRRLRARSLAGLISEACRISYPHTPEIRNEMLGRHQLTSQGAKARRELQTAMITSPASGALDIHGYGPGYAMYSGVLAYLGLHQPVHGQDHTSVRADTATVEYAFTAPEEDSSLQPAWHALSDRIAAATSETPITDLLGLLMAPPYGIKAGVTPVILLATLLVRSDEIVLFEEGTYQPRLTPDLAERLTKTPQRFSFASVPTSTQQRRLVLNELSSALNLRARSAGRRPTQTRNPALLAVTRALLDRVRGLSRYAIRTRRLSATAHAVRDALTGARDPGELVFTALPRAVNLQTITHDTPPDEPAARGFAEQLTAALDEIQSADRQLQDDVVTILASEFQLHNRLSALRRDLASKARGLVDAPLDPALKGLVTVALNDTLGDEDWLDPLAVRLVNTGLNDWTDDHLPQFRDQARALARALDRVSHLATSSPSTHDTEMPAQLITLTSHDGNEHQALVHLPQQAQDTATDLAHTTIEQAKQRLGTAGPRALLVALAQQLLTPHTELASPSADSEHLTDPREVTIP